MTSVYFVRHAQPEHSWEDDRTPPLTDEGIKDCEKVTEALRNYKIDCYLSSPYKRSIDTIKSSSKVHGMDILTDERFREREKGLKGNEFGMFQKRWNDFDFHEDGGERLKTGLYWRRTLIVSAGSIPELSWDEYIKEA